MRKLILITLTVLLSSCLTPHTTHIEGVWDRGDEQVIRLFKVDQNSSLLVVDSALLDENNRFSFSFVPTREQLYIIGANEGRLANQYHFYLKPGDELSFIVTEQGYELTGENTAENIELRHWYNFIYPLRVMALYPQGIMSDYTTFFPLLQERYNLVEKAIKTSTPNRRFNTFAEGYKKLNFISLANTFINTPRTTQPKLADHPDFYRQWVNLAKITQGDEILSYPEGIKLLKMVAVTELRLNDTISEEEMMTTNRSYEYLFLENRHISKISNPKIKAALIVNLAANIKSYAGLSDYIDRYGDQLVSEQERAVLSRLQAKRLAELESQPLAANFTFSDGEGRAYSLSDFKGKVVYIDLWATWCTFCIAEFPKLKALQNEYREVDNLLFVGISIDKESDKAKWKTFVERNELLGLQLFADEKGADQFKKEYSVQGIPHFILIDKEGAVVSNKAPYPSSPEIRALLNHTLNN